MKKNNNNDKNFSPENLDKVIEDVWINGTNSEHIPGEELSEYVELIIQEGEDQALKNMPVLAKHLIECSQCFNQHLLLLDTIKNPEFDNQYSPDLSFLSNKKEVWKQLNSKVWSLVDKIKIQIDKVQLDLQTMIEPVQLVPFQAHAVRSKAVTPADGGPGILTFKWPESNKLLKIYIEGTLRGSVQLIVLGIEENGKTDQENLFGSLTFLRDQSIIPYTKIKNKGLDFGLIQYGEYDLEIEYREEKISVQLQLGDF